MKARRGSNQALEIIDEMIEKKVNTIDKVIGDKRRGFEARGNTGLSVRVNEDMHSLTISYLDRPMFVINYKMHINEFYLKNYSAEDMETAIKMSSQLGSHIAAPTTSMILTQAEWLSQWNNEKTREKQLSHLMKTFSRYGGFSSLHYLFEIRLVASKLKSGKQVMAYLATNNIMTLEHEELDAIRLEAQIKELGIKKFDDFQGKKLGTGTDGKLYCLTEKNTLQIVG